MERRSFLKTACRACLMGAGALAVADSLSSCSPAVARQLAYSPAVVNNQVEVPFTLFEKQPLVVISPAKYEYEISVEKAENTYKALLLKCTHYDNQLTPTGNGYTCSLHGSKFSKDGVVTKGPAERNLRQLKTETLNDHLLIYL